MAREDSHGATRLVAYVTPQYSGADDAAAHPADFSYVPDAECDTVILNYIVKYFPSVRRLFGVVEGAIISIRSLQFFRARRPPAAGDESRQSSQTGRY